LAPPAEVLSFSDLPRAALRQGRRGLLSARKAAGKNLLSGGARRYPPAQDGARRGLDPVIR
jgi:hypothetical protein